MARLQQTFYLQRSGKTVRQARFWLGSIPKSWLREMSFCRNIPANLESIAKEDKVAGRPRAETENERQLREEVRVQKSKPLKARIKDFTHFLRFRLGDVSRAWEIPWECWDSETGSVTQTEKFDYLFRTAEAVYLKCAGKFNATCIAKSKDSEYLLNFFAPIKMTR